MAAKSALAIDEIIDRLDQYLEVEFTFIRTEGVSAVLAAMPRERQEFILDWTRRAAATNIELAFQFANRAKEALHEVDPDVVAAWCLHAMDSYDRAGLQHAMTVIRDLDGFLVQGHQRAAASMYGDAVGVLRPYVQGLDGRMLKLASAASDGVVWTDGETLYLPELVARLERREDNFQLYKSIATHLWAQSRYGTLNVNLVEALQHYPDMDRALDLFHALETLRLDARIASELPGLYRRMRGLSVQLDDPARPAAWADAQAHLAQPMAGVHDTLVWLARLYPHSDSVVSWCYQGQLRPAAAWDARVRRIERDKARLRETLRVIAKEVVEGRSDRAPPESFELREKPRAEGNRVLEVELSLQDQPLAVPDRVRDYLTSILLDLGEIPPEYLTPAGEGEYDPSFIQDERLDPNQVWAGAYHEEGAFFYNEWDTARKAYKKNWCVLREMDTVPGDPAFYHQTLQKYASLVRSLRRTFEVLRGEDKILRRQTDGDDIDIDALVEAWGDVHGGLEMSEHLFTRLHKDDRNIAVMFMVDMSGSTRGWINDAEREALILLAESLQTLGDRYAIYGFSGWTRKRCETFRIKDFDEPWNDDVIGRVCGIEPKDYTRMGAPIRHLTGKLKAVNARIKLLITLSDGKPDDYDLEYRGQYGIEDTRQALYEAHCEGVHAYCITIDREGQDYLPHMYGAANYTVLDDIAQLPLKVSDIYRKITT